MMGRQEPWCLSVLCVALYCFFAIELRQIARPMRWLAPLIHCATILAVHRIIGGYFEQAVVFEKIAGDRALKVMVPCDEAVADDLAPEIFKVWINVAMAYAMGTQNGNCHVISL